jgi:dipeptidyl aminopeptidase/acylaminoacyl peptidase
VRASTTSAIALALAVLPLAALGRPWTLSDTLTVEFMDDVQIAPNGNAALVDVVHADLKHNTFAAAYSLVDIASGRMRPLDSELGHPRWSPHGDSIAWIASDSAGKTRIVLTDVQGNHQRAITSGTRQIIGFAWSPSAASIAAVETEPAAANNTSSGSRLRWLSLGNDYHDTHPAQREIWLLDVANGAEHAVTHDSWSYGGPVTDHDPSWAANGKQLVVVRQPSPVYADFERAQYVTIALSSGKAQPILNHPFFAYPSSAAPVFSPQGSTIAYTHTWDGNLASREDVFVGARDVSAPLDRDLWTCGSGTITWRSGVLLASLLDGVSMRLYKLDPNGSSAPRALTSTGGSVEAYSIASNGRIAYVWTTPERPTELYVLDPSHAPRQITHVAQIAPTLAVATTRFVTWQDGAGHTLHGQLTLPTTASPRTAPLVLEPHGGPQCADDASFSGFAQYLASNGYAYFRPDPPGSDGYGDWSYKAIINDWGPGPMSADFAGLDAVNAMGVGDPARTFIEGGSYGGYLTSWIVTHSQRFRAAVAQVPVTDLLLEYTLSESPNITRRFFGAKPTTNATLLAAQSPQTFVADEHTPLLVIAGLADTRAPYMQAIEFFKSLAEQGAPVRMLADPKAGHGPSDPQGVMAWQAATMAWLAQHGGIAIPDAKLPQ